MGFVDQMRLNMHNFSQITYEADQWYRVDVLLDWNTEQAAFFIDGKFKTRTEFYTLERDAQLSCDVHFVNTLFLYTLTPGVTSSFKDIRLCSNLCPGT